MWHFFHSRLQALVKFNKTKSSSQIGTRIGVRHCSDGTMHMCLNGEDLGVAASNIPKVCSFHFFSIVFIESILFISSDTDVYHPELLKLFIT